MFSRQDGYGTFTIGRSEIKSVRTHIQNQEEHRGKWRFQEEYRAILEQYGIEVDDGYLW
jgi:putative transposase